MNRPTICVFVLAALSFALSSCAGTPLFKTIKPGPRASFPESNINMIRAAELHSEPLAHKCLRIISAFFREYRNPILAIVGLMFLWIFARGYHFERTNKHNNLSIEDIGIMKVISDNALRIWGKYKPRNNIINLNDFRNLF